jgi:hypothetical protein
MLKLFGSADVNLPRVEKFFNEAQFVFKNAFNGLGWTTIANYTQANISPSEFFFSLYDDEGALGLHDHVWRLPTKRSGNAEQGFYRDNYFEKDYLGKAKEAEQFFRKPHEVPFFAVVHFKYLHYPMIDRFNKESAWDRYLSADEKVLVAEYLAHPEVHYRKLPLILMLANDPKHLLAHPRYRELAKSAGKNGLRKLMGTMTNPELLADWKNSPGYAADLDILKKIYRANVNFLDQVIEPFLNVWDDPVLKKNTVVMFIGDHGEAHMERDELTHGSALWDPMIRVPAAIRFPQGAGHAVFERQIDGVGLSYVLRDLVTGTRSSAAFRVSLDKNFRDVIPLRNCANDIRGLRYSNKYKYFVTLRDGERHLYDLVKDPGEAVNIANENPDQVANMESLYWQSLSSLSNVGTDNCAPTVF